MWYKISGYALISLPFVAVFVVIGKAAAWWYACALFGCLSIGTGVLSLIIWSGLTLIEKGCRTGGHDGR